MQQNMIVDRASSSPPHLSPLPLLIAFSVQILLFQDDKRDSDDDDGPNIMRVEWSSVKYSVCWCVAIWQERHNHFEYFFDVS